MALVSPLAAPRLIAVTSWASRESVFNHLALSINLACSTLHHLGPNRCTNERLCLYGAQKPCEKPEALFGLGVSSTSASNGRLHCHAKDEACYRSSNAFLWVSPGKDRTYFRFPQS